jgi:hypothetical protein
MKRDQLKRAPQSLSLALWQGVLASCNRDAEHVGVKPIVVAELKFGDVKRHIFAAYLAARPIGPAFRIQRGV